MEIINPLFAKCNRFLLDNVTFEMKKWKIRE